MLKALPALGAVVVASMLLIPTVSLAGTMNGGADDEFASQVVPYLDLNLARETDIKKLQWRVHYAAEDVCGGRPLPALQVGVRAGCVRSAVASAKPAYERAIGAARRGTVTVSDATALIVTAPR